MIAGHKALLRFRKNDPQASSRWIRAEATIRQVAADLGINPETLRNWVRAAGASRPRGRRTGSTRRAAHAAGSGERSPAQKGP
ncbi:transposase [Streptomyces sp. NPDC059153]|uniref:transposase n=1 Tax=Streptomyces sp. NPDC059153 TaxID=3346743 RepID=UPI003699B404